jgi:putative flippase GtrA
VDSSPGWRCCMTAQVTKLPLSRRFHLPAWIGQALRFGVVGCLNTLVDAALYLALTRGLPFFALYPALAKAISYPAGVVNSFYWNKNWTFRSQAGRAGWKAFLPFALVNLLGVLINVAAMQVCLDALSFSEALAFISATGVTLAWNFLASKLIVFRKGSWFVE